MAGPEHYLAVADVAPQVGVGVSHRVGDDGEEQDEGGRVFTDRARAGQRAAALTIDWRACQALIPAGSWAGSLVRFPIAL
jgi:hypothetical protein